MLRENYNHLLEPGYLPIETGYHRLPNGQMYIATLTPMRDCRAEWINWWFINHLKYYNSTRGEPVAPYVTIWDRNRQPGRYMGTAQVGEIKLGPSLRKFKIKYENPANYFDTSRFAEYKIKGVICGKLFFPDGSLEGNIVHLIRDTSYGCEIRTRLWTYDLSEENAKLHIERFLAINSLSDLLKKSFENPDLISDKTSTTCKYCQSSRIVRNGSRKGLQYWLCKDCGHSFTGNGALPKMKYPITIVDMAISQYSAGHSINHICKEIEKKTGILPSTSTIFRWIRLFSPEGQIDLQATSG